MKVSDLFTDGHAMVYVVVDSAPAGMPDWEVEPVDTWLIPGDDGTYLVRAMQVFPAGTCDGFMVVSTPERVVDMVILKRENGTLDVQSIDALPFRVIPSIAAACYGNYELYYVKENPQTGIDVLRDGLIKAIDKSVVAEDLGYMLRDEQRYEEAIEAFLISTEYGPSSPFVYYELAQLFQAVGMADQSAYFQQLFQERTET